MTDRRDEMRAAHLKWSKREHAFVGLSDEEIAVCSLTPFEEGWKAGAADERKRSEGLVQALEFYRDADEDDGGTVASEALAEYRGEK